MRTTVSGVLQGELSFCKCGATGDEGHTFSCIMFQRDKRLEQERLVSSFADLQEEAEYYQWENA